MASIEGMVLTLAVLYSAWAVLLSNSRFHQVWSLSILLLDLLAQQVKQAPVSRENLLPLVCLIADAILCVALSPLPSLFREKREFSSPSLEIVCEEDEETCIE